MQNRYAGDVGDYGKLALLKALDEQLKVGVNWYLVDAPDEKTNDGRHIQYLNKTESELFQCDLLLARRLKEIVGSERSVFNLGKILQDITYYNALVPVDNRANWHEDAVSTLRKCDIVFLDPDNGLLVQSVKKTASKSVKYMFEEEAARYYAEGCSVVFYNHRSREPKEKYRRRLIGLYENPIFADAAKLALTYHAYSVRDYFFILQPRHKQLVNDVVAAFLASGWKDYFKLYNI